MKDPQTTVGGVITAAGAFLMALGHGGLDLTSLGTFILGIGSLWIGWRAKDADTHSTQSEVQAATVRANIAAGAK